MKTESEKTDQDPRTASSIDESPEPITEALPTGAHRRILPPTRRLVTIARQTLIDALLADRVAAVRNEYKGCNPFRRLYDPSAPRMVKSYAEQRLFRAWAVWALQTELTEDGIARQSFQEFCALVPPTPTLRNENALRFAQAFPRLILHDPQLTLEALFRVCAITPPQCTIIDTAAPMVNHDFLCIDAGRQRAKIANFEPCQAKQRTNPVRRYPTLRELLFIILETNGILSAVIERRVFPVALGSMPEGKPGLIFYVTATQKRRLRIERAADNGMDQRFIFPAIWERQP